MVSPLFPTTAHYDFPSRRRTMPRRIPEGEHRSPIRRFLFETAAGFDIRVRMFAGAHDALPFPLGRYKVAGRDSREIGCLKLFELRQRSRQRELMGFIFLSETSLLLLVLLLLLLVWKRRSSIDVEIYVET